MSVSSLLHKNKVGNNQTPIQQDDQKSFISLYWAEMLGYFYTLISVLSWNERPSVSCRLGNQTNLAVKVD